MDDLEQQFFAGNDDLEAQFFAGDDNLEQQFFAEPTQESTPRGTNFAGAVRNVAQGLPFGTWADELEGALRATKQWVRNVDPTVSQSKKTNQTWQELYDIYKKNAEESALGNIKNTGYGLPLNIGSNIVGNALLTAGTGGINLLPIVSGAQGAAEGFGRGSNTEERGVNALIEGGIGTVIPAAFNKVMTGSFKWGGPELSKGVKAITAGDEPAIRALRDYAAGLSGSLNESLGKQIGYQTQKQDAKDIARNLRSNNRLFRAFRKEAEAQPTWRERVVDVIDDVIDEAPKKDATKLVKARNEIARKITDAPDVDVGFDALTDDVITNFGSRNTVNEINDALSGYKISRATNANLTNKLNQLKGTRRAEKIALGIDDKTVGLNRSPNLTLAGFSLGKLKSGMRDIGKISGPQYFLAKHGVGDQAVGQGLSLVETLIENALK